MSTFRNLIIVLSMIFMLTSESVAQTLIVSEIVSSNTNSLLDANGDAPDWIELYNTGDEPLDLTSFWLSDDFDDPDKWIFPTTTLGSHEYLIIFASGTEIDPVHTNFSLNAGGEELVLSDPNGNIIDSVLIPALPTDVSYGRLPNDGSEWFYFLEPTPAAENSTQSYDTPTPLMVEFSPPGGLYWGQVNLTLTAYFPEDTIYYTLDGSLPTIHSEIASATLEIYETTVVRARILSQGMLSDRPSTHTYIIDKDTDLPVIAIAAEPPDLWDQNNGIYVNWESDREIPIHLEFYEPGGLRGFSQDAGMKMFGGWSRHFPQKSFALFARSEYGPSDFAYRIFPDLPFEYYEAFVLRNSGGDFDVSHIRDAMMQTLINDINIDLQAYRPAVIYLNGEYWGILNVREKLNEHYIEAHHGVIENDLDMLENNRNVIHGNSQHFSAFLDYLNTHDMTLLESYDHVNMQIDLDEYLNYMVSEIYFANVDWPGWNLKYWRPRTTDGKWRWITYDLDDGFNLGRPEHYGYDNMFDFATATDGDGWPNPPWSTLVFRKLLENNQFVVDFTNRYADHMNSIWQSDHVISTIDNLQDEIAQEMVLHLERWNLSNDDWLWEMDRLRNFATERVDEARSIISEELGVGGLVKLSLAIEPAGSGKIRLNDNLDVWSPQWEGHYYSNIPVEALAIPNPGYSFVAWATGNDNPISPLLDISFSGDTVLVAVFELTGAPISPVVINEINYHSAPEFDTDDWIELYNRSEEVVDISGWTFMDDNDDHQLVLSEGTLISANGFVVICQTRAQFLAHFPDAVPLEETFAFGLNNSGEKIRLMDSNNEVADSLWYHVNLPWPASPDGQGATLVLNNPYSDNAQPGSWGASWDHGSPGLSNDIITDIEPSAFNPTPTSFLLSNNFPNPFNASTMIQYQLPDDSEVSLVVFDISGRKVQTLVNARKSAGQYSISWDARNSAGQVVPSGLYFYTIQAGHFIQSDKMLLLK